MQVHINADKNISGALGLQDRVEEVLAQELKPVAEHVTRVDVHLNDLKKGKKGYDDMRCQIEARLKGREPISVEQRASDIYQALHNAARQLRRALGNEQGKLDAVTRTRDSIRYATPDGVDIGKPDVE